MLSEDDLHTMEHCIWSSRNIPNYLANKLDRLAYDIEKDAEYLRFGLPFKNVYREDLEEFRKLRREYVQYVQVPKWEPGENGWTLNKDTFKLPDGTPGPYDIHLEELQDIVIQMREVIRRITIRADMYWAQVPSSYIEICRRFSRV